MKTMQRSFAVLLVLAMVLGLVACGAPAQKDPTQENQNVSQNDTTNETTGGKTTEPTETDATVAATEPTAAATEPTVAATEAPVTPTEVPSKDPNELPPVPITEPKEDDASQAPTLQDNELELDYIIPPTTEP